MSTIEERVREILEGSLPHTVATVRIEYLLAKSLDALEERVEEMDRSARDTDLRVDAVEGNFYAQWDAARDAVLAMKPRLDMHRDKILELEARVHLLNLERAMDAPAPKPNTEPSELVKLVRDRSHDPMYAAMGGHPYGSRHYWRGTNAYAEDAILAVANWLAVEQYAHAAAALRAQLEP